MPAAAPQPMSSDSFTTRLKLVDSRIDRKAEQAEAEVARSSRAVSGFCKKTSESKTRLSIKAFSAKELDEEDDLDTEESEDEDTKPGPTQ